MTTFKLPDLGEGLEEAEIVAWHVGEGDHVIADQPLVSVETDKAVVEVPAPASGRIVKLAGAPGDVIKVGAPLVELASAERTDAGTVVGELAEPEAVEPAYEPPMERVCAPAAAATARATPAVRALATKLGVDLGTISPSGPDDSITRDDVERAARALPGDGAGEAMRGMRRAMAQRMAKAHAEVVPAAVMDEADIGEWPAGTDISIRVIRAIATACRAEPALNARFDGGSGARRLLERIDVGIAVDTEDGLIVPVLRNVGAREPADLRAGMERLRADARARTIPPHELRGATISMSNFGMIGGRYAQLVVVPPQVAIIGVGRVRDGVVARDGQPVVSRLMPLTLAFDHRVVTGGEGARFLKALKADLEKFC
ncbi:MAG: dihydrolipoamide acetyltransferase family protein [Hyphomicrobiaceae bacterium]